MYVFFLFTILASVVLGTLQMSGAFKDDVIRAKERAPIELQRYRNFTESVEAWVEANPTYVGTVTWTTLKTADTTPPAFKGVAMPMSFKAVINAGQYVVCGELDQAALALLVQDMPEEMQGRQPNLAGSQEFHVLGPATIDYAAEATKCQ